MLLILKGSCHIREMHWLGLAFVMATREHVPSPFARWRALRESVHWPDVWPDVRPDVWPDGWPDVVPNSPQLFFELYDFSVLVLFG